MSVCNIAQPNLPLPELSPMSAPEKAKLVQGIDGSLAVFHNEETVPVKLRPCFPWSDPSRFLSLRDDKGEEVMLVDDLRLLEPVQKALVEKTLAEAGFLLEIENLESIQEELEIRNWKVTTRQGPRTFQTKLDEWPRSLPGGGYLIRDVAGDLYFVRNPAELDARSQKVLWAFID